MCADSHEMSAPPLEWADWSAQSPRIIFSALVSGQHTYQNGHGVVERIHLASELPGVSKLCTNLSHSW